MNLLRSWLERNRPVFVHAARVLGTEVDMGVYSKGQINGIE